MHEESWIYRHLLARLQLTRIRHWRTHVLTNHLGVVVFSCKSSQAIFIEEALEFRSHLSDEHVDAEVKLLAIDKIRIVFVYLDHLARVSWNVFDLASQEDAFALT